MFRMLRSLLAAKQPLASIQELAPASVRYKDVEFALAPHLKWHNGYPLLDWQKVRAWVDAIISEDERARAWDACGRAWVLHFRDALGPAFHLVESDTARVLSSLAPNVAQAAADFMGKTLRRIQTVLGGIAQPAPWGKDLLIVFDDQERYYRYVSYYYPESGEFAFSGGMHINGDGSHFVTVKDDLRQIEPVIAHEMTHACLGHLPLPAWLNEGLAVNTERRLTGVRPVLTTPERMHHKHRRFWSVVSIQRFWSGKSFMEPGESNTLSYDLARIIVEQLARDWETFKQFVLVADRADAGAAAARKCLGLELGELVTRLLERDTPRSWSPDPAQWDGEAERGGFQEERWVHLI